MVIDVPYVSLKHTLLALKLQVQDSMPYVEKYVPYNINSPAELFRFLKPQFKYKNDPPGVELIRTLQTLFRNKGQGDCDCFTVAALASLIWLGFTDVYVAIVGNTKQGPTHIYAEVYDQDKGKITPIDFTNPIYNMQRDYKYKQRLPFDLNDDMRLRLADGEGERSRVRTIVDRETGELFSCGGEPTELSMRGMHRYRHATHRQGREDRVQMRVDARNAKLQSRLDKKANRGGGGGGDSGGDDGGGDDQDYDDQGGDDTEMGDYALSGVGKTIGKIFGKKKKATGGDAGEASGGAGGIGKVKIKSTPDESDNPANKYVAAAQKKDSWFDGETMGIDNKFVAVAGAGLLLLLAKNR